MVLTNLLVNMPAPDQITMYINIFALVIIGISALFGLKRGMFKSVYKLIWTLIIVVGGWLLADFVVAKILAMDLSSYNLEVTLMDNTYHINNANDFAVEFLHNQFFSSVSLADLQKSTSFSLVVGCAGMLVRVVYFVLLLVLGLTVFKFIRWIIWLIIKPKKKVDPETGKKKKRKPKGLSRLGGMVFSAARASLKLLLLFFIFSGVLSIATSVGSITNSLGTEDVYSIVLIKDQAVLVRTSQKCESSSNPLDEYADYFNVYRDSVAGKVFGSVKIGETSIDNYLFDDLLAIDVQSGEDTFSIELRKEIETAVNIISAIPNMEGGFNLDTLTSLDEETLGSIIDNLSSLSLVKVAIPVGLEVVIAGDILTENMDEATVSALRSINIKDIGGMINGESDVKNIGYAFIDILSVMETDEEGKMKIDFMNIPSSVFTRLGDLGVIDAVGPIGISYLMSNESFKSTLEQLGIDINDLGLDSITDWGAEIAKLGDIYAAFCDLGLSFEQLSKLDFSNVNMEKIDALCDAIGSSTVIEKILPVLMVKLGDMVPDDYKSLFDAVVDEDIDIIDELKPLLKAVVTLAKSGILNSEDMMASLKNLSEQTIDDLANYLSESKLVTRGLNELIGALLSGDNSVLGNVEVKKLDSAADWNKTEISSIFKALKNVLDLGLLDGGNDTMAVIQNLSDEAIDNLATNLGNSKFIRRNLSSILGSVLNGIIESDEIQFVILEEEDWTKAEIKSIFSAVKDVIDLGLFSSGDPMEALKSISNENIEKLGKDLSCSKFITSNLNPLINYILSSGGGNLFGDMEIRGLDSAEDWTELEITSIFKSLNDIVALGLFDGNGDAMDAIKNLEDEKIEALCTDVSNSKFIKRNMAGVMTKLLSSFLSDKAIEVSFDENDWNKNDLESLFKLVKMVTNMSLFTDSSITVDFNDSNSVDAISDLIKQVGDILGDLDELRNGLESNNIKKLINDILIYFVVTYPDELEDGAGLAILKCADQAEKDARIDAIVNQPLKDGLFVIIANALITSMSSQEGMEFLANITFVSFEQFEKELANIGNLVQFYSELGSEGASLEDLSTDDIKELISEMGESEIVTGAIEGLASEQLGIDVDLSEIDWAQEAEVVGSLIDVAQAEDLSELDTTKLAEDLASSELVLVVASAIEPGALPVSDDQFEEIKGVLEAQDIPEENLETLLALFPQFSK